jgi:N-acyl-D-amino-acid deacylase
MLDLVIRGGLVVDGTHPSRRTDVGIRGEQISAVGSGLGPARRSVDASGKLVAPGFIDMHTHSDFTLPVRPSAEAKLRQGVTTDVTGNCGFSPFPLAEDVPALQHGEFLELELRERWPTLEAYAEEIEDRGLGINVAPLVGLGAVRLSVLGEDDVRADDAALARMGELLRQAMQEGAFGASSGLVYAPSSFADVNELSTLAGVVAAEGGLYATHMRNEGEELIEALDEAIEVARRSGCRLQISHLKALGRPNWGKVVDALDHIDEANRSGCDVWADAYPYTAGSSTLASLLPAEALDGGEEALRQRLAIPEERIRLARILDAGPTFALQDVLLATVPGHPEMGGSSIEKIADQEGIERAEVVFRLLERNGAKTSMVAFGMAEDDVRKILRHPQTLLGSDGWTMTTDAVDYAHPRSFATTARLLARYVRDERVLDLTSAIAKLAYRPARRLGLVDRGVVLAGAIADLVVIDLERLSEESTFAHPCAYPLGIDHVFVAGQAAIEDGVLTGQRAGRVLRKSANRSGG